MACQAQNKNVSKWLNMGPALDTKGTEKTDIEPGDKLGKTRPSMTVMSLWVTLSARLLAIIKF